MDLEQALVTLEDRLQVYQAVTKLRWSLARALS